MDSTRRLRSELIELQKKYTTTCSSVELVNDNIYQWKVALIGPPDSPYEDGSFEISINFPVEYPFRPPNVQFLTPVFHPNISNEGKICLEILQGKWSAAYTIPTLVVSLRSMISDPSLSSVINAEAGKLYTANRELYNKKVREMTEQYAKKVTPTVVQNSSFGNHSSTSRIAGSNLKSGGSTRNNQVRLGTPQNVVRSQVRPAFTSRRDFENTNSVAPVQNVVEQVTNAQKTERSNTRVRNETGSSSSTTKSQQDNTEQESHCCLS